MKFTLTRLQVFGDYIVYRRGNWAKREHVPLYLVSRESDGRDLEEFRRRKSALNWARDQNWRDTCKKQATMTDTRSNTILHCVARTGQVTADTTADELAQLDDMVVRDGDEYSLTTLGEMEIGE